jgi:UPF0716 family protein affecting phage T7 exclusion
MASALLVLLLPLADNPDPVPAKEDVTAGWTALLVFLFLIVAVVVLARSLVKQLRKAQAARETGVYGDPPTGSDGESQAADESNGHPAQP